MNYSLGIDAHKKFSFWTLIDKKGKIVFQGKIISRPEAIKEAIEKYLPPSTKAVMEPVESWPWYCQIFEEKNIEIVLAHPLEVKAIAHSKLKHDRIDSLILAQLLRSDFLPKAYLAPLKIRNLREILRLRCFLTKQRTQIKNRIHGILTKNAIFHNFSDLFGKKGIKWLKSLELREPFLKEIQTLLNLLEEINQKIKEINKTLQRIAKTDKEIEILTSIPGIGYFSALMIKAEIGDFSRFPKASRVSSYAGLVPSSYSSGDKLRFGKITKKGSPYLRWIMVEVAQKVNPSWGRLYEFYQRIKLKKGTKTAKVALARKMLEIAWTLIKKKEFFKRDFKENKRP